MDLAGAINENLQTTVPLVATLGIVVEEVTLDPVKAVAVLPDRPAQRNHVGGPHAGAIFTMAETASGAVVQALFRDLFQVATPLIMNGEMSYRALALGPVRGEATLRDGQSEIARVRSELADEKRPEFFIDVQITTANGITGTLKTHWTLKPVNRVQQKFN